MTLLLHKPNTHQWTSYRELNSSPVYSANPTTEGGLNEFRSVISVLVLKKHLFGVYANNSLQSAGGPRFESHKVRKLLVGGGPLSPFTSQLHSRGYTVLFPYPSLQCTYPYIVPHRKLSEGIMESSDIWENLVERKLVLLPILAFLRRTRFAVDIVFDVLFRTIFSFSVCIKSSAL